MPLGAECLVLARQCRGKKKDAPGRWSRTRYTRGKHWDPLSRDPAVEEQQPASMRRQGLRVEMAVWVWEHMMHELALTDQGQGVASLCVKYAPLQHLGWDQAQNNARDEFPSGLQLKSFRGVTSILGDRDA